MSVIKPDSETKVLAVTEIGITSLAWPTFILGCLFMGFGAGVGSALTIYLLQPEPAGLHQRQDDRSDDAERVRDGMLRDTRPETRMVVDDVRGWRLVNRKVSADQVAH